jgi:hypothetical protein
MSAASACLAQTYQESGGLVVMEAENTSSPLGLWQEENTLNDFSGSGYLRFLGNTFENGPPNSPLEYRFQINQPGLYYLHLHCAKETHEGRTDVANDVYVRVEGDFTAGPGPHDGHGDNASLALLQNDTKYFGGATNAWKWENGQNSSGGNGNLDPGGHQNKRVAVYNFQAGQTYTLVMSGRSKFFRVNRLVFRHVDAAQAMAQNLNTAESATSAGSPTVVYDAIDDFTDITSGDVPYYTDNGNDVLAIAANVEANRIGFARAIRAFDGPAGTYDVTITTLTEEDGESEYHLLVNGVRVRSFTNPFVYDPPDTPLDLQPHLHTWTGVMIPAGATIGIESNADTNGEIPENEGTAWARGRWRQLEFSLSQGSLIQPPPGRIAIVADGNSPDPDDIGATAVMLGIFKGAGLRDKLVHLSHSCDLDPFKNPGSQVIDASNELRRQNKLHSLCGEGIGFFGPFENLANYYNCRTSVVGDYNEQAVNDLRDAINASSAEDPLWVIEAGEPDVIGYALQAATASKRQFVHVISHHPANDNSGDFFTWQQILDFGVIEHQIGDQNVGLQVLISSGLWDWAENHPTPGIAWIWDQLDYAEKDGVVAFQNNKFDCSDAGMLYWWMTGGPNGGDNASTPVEMRSLLLDEPLDVDFPAAHWPLDEGSGTSAVDTSGRGFNGTLQNGASWGSDATRDSYVTLDGNDDRISTLFTYALSSTDDFTWAWWANQQSTGTADNGAIMVGNRYPQPGAGGDTFEFIKLTPTHGQFSATSDVAQIERYEYGALAQGTWHHYAMVKSGPSYQWYVDGIPQGVPVTMSYHQTAPLPFFIGGDDNGTGKPNEHFEGFIDDVVLYQKALSEEEIEQVRNGIYGPATPVAPVIELLAGWDTWSNGTAPTPTFLADNVSASVAITSQGLAWGVNDERGASIDGTWGNFAGEPAASDRVASQENLTLFNATTGGTLSFTITNEGATDLLLEGFHFDAYAFRPKAARVYSLHIPDGGGLSSGNVFTSPDEALTSVGGASRNDAHDSIDISLNGLVDQTLAVGESVVFELSFSGGAGDGSGGHHLFVDNVALTHSVSAAPNTAPEVEAGAGASVTLPESEVQLEGVASDEGAIVTIVWTQEAGPGTASLSDVNVLNPLVSNLQEGSYLFRLTVTDDQGSSAFDEVAILVLPSDYVVWAREQNIPEGMDASEEGDPDGDGRSNRFEYLFGLNPMESSSLSPFVTGLKKDSGTFRYTRRNPSLTGVFDYQIWISENLSSWIQDLTASQETEEDRELQEVLVTLSEGNRSEEKLFVRIVAE